MTPATERGLDARVVVRRPGYCLDVDLRARPGDVVAVVGPNGAGKSTLLRALAGIQPMDEGRVVCDGQVWDAPDRRSVDARHRGVGVVFQQDLLFPHLTALGNVAYGARARGVGRRAAEERARGWLERLDVGAFAHRVPAQLSGGQAQRVSIARALATEPRLLLLDEPLSSLDVGVAMALRLELSRHLAAYDGVAVLVTHDALDAMTLANRVVVLDDGKVAQEGTPEEVARRPRTDHVARLVGLNVMRGLSRGTTVRLGDGTALITATAAEGRVDACFSPAAVTITVTEPTGSARNRWPATVGTVAPHGSAVRVHLETGPGRTGLIADVTPASAAQLALAPGARVWATVKATEIAVYGGD